MPQSPAPLAFARDEQDVAHQACQQCGQEPASVGVIEAARPGVPSLPTEPSDTHEAQGSERLGDPDPRPRLPPFRHQQAGHAQRSPNHAHADAHGPSVADCRNRFRCNSPAWRTAAKAMHAVHHGRAWPHRRPPPPHPTAGGRQLRDPRACGARADPRRSPRSPRCPSGVDPAAPGQIAPRKPGWEGANAAGAAVRRLERRPPIGWPGSRVPRGRKVCVPSDGVAYSDRRSDPSGSASRPYSKVSPAAVVNVPPRRSAACVAVPASTPPSASQYRATWLPSKVET